MIVLRSPKGWTGPEGGRRQEGRGLLALAPGAGRQLRGRTPAHRAAARRLDAQLRARGAVRRGRAADAGARRACARRASGAWAPTRMPMADCCKRELDAAGLSRLCGRRAAARRRRRARRRASWARYLRDVMRLNAEAPEFPHHGPGRDRLQPARRRVRGDRPRLDGGDRALRRPSRAATAASWRS